MENKFGFSYPRFRCKDCCFKKDQPMITIGNQLYWDELMNEKNWWYTDFISSFAALVGHDAHNSKLMFLHCQYPGEMLVEEMTSAIPKEVQTVLSVIFADGHYAVMEIDIHERIIRICDGLKLSLERWKMHIVHALKRIQLLVLNDEATFVTTMDHHKQLNMKVKGDVDWIVKSDSFVVQRDGWNCGPIACLKIWKMFSPGSLDMNKLEVGEYRKKILDKYQQLIEKVRGDLHYEKKNGTRPGGNGGFV